MSRKVNVRCVNYGAFDNVRCGSFDSAFPGNSRIPSFTQKKGGENITGAVRQPGRKKDAREEEIKVIFSENNSTLLINQDLEGYDMTRMLTVDAVVIKGGKILLVRRKNNPFKGCYALPGGYVEKSESVKDALIRETMEETGLTINPKKFIGFYDGPERDHRGNVSIAFLCEIKTGRPEAGSDSSEVNFFAMNKLPPKLAFDHEKIIADAIKMSGKKKVLAGGVFNIVHPGHVHFLKKAKELGDELVVVVAHDKTVLKNKKNLMFPASVRAQTVRNIRDVSKVVIGDDTDMMKVVKRERPDIIAIGYDQDDKLIKKMLSETGIECELVKIGRLKGYSTKKITGG